MLSQFFGGEGRENAGEIKMGLGETASRMALHCRPDVGRNGQLGFARSPLVARYFWRLKGKFFAFPLASQINVATFAA